MKTRVRETLVSRRSWLLAGLTVPLSRAWELQQLQLRYDGDALHVSAPSLHFITGNPLKRMNDGDAVAYIANLSLLDDTRASVRHQRGRFVISYALWEERFSVSLLGGSTANGLTATAAEAWCLEHLAINTAGLAADRYYWLRFDIGTVNASDLAAEGIPGYRLSDVIKMLGRKKTEQTQWGPFERRIRLADLPRIAARGPRG